VRILGRESLAVETDECFELPQPVRLAATVAATSVQEIRLKKAISMGSRAKPRLATV
jgi:hypothetical protein